MKRTSFFALAFYFTAFSLTAQKPELIPRQDGHTSEVNHVCFSPDERQALSADYNRIVLWDLNSGKFIRFIKTETQPMFLCFSPDAALAVAILKDNSLQAWNLDTGERLWRIEMPGKSLVMAQVSPDGQTLAVCSDNRDISCWVLGTGLLRWKKKLPKATPASIYFSENGASITLNNSKGACLANYVTISGKTLASKPEQTSISSKSLFFLPGNKAIDLQY